MDRQRIKRRDPQSSKDWRYHRGDIYLVNLNPRKGSEQGGTRPVLVLQNNDGNFFSPTLIVAPMTTQLKKRNQPTHVVFDGVPGLPETSMVSLEQIDTIDKSRIISYIGRISRKQLAAVDEACLVSLGITVPECVEAP